MRRPPPGFRWLIPLLGCLAVLAAPTPAGLTPEGQRVLAVIVLAIGLWGLEAVPSGVTAIVAIVALVGTGAVAGIREGLAGFADPIAFFLVGVLTMGAAVARSGLAERIAHQLLAHGRGRAGALYLHLLLAMPLLSCCFLGQRAPASSSRWRPGPRARRVPRGARSRAVMMLLNSVNRSLTGGITPSAAGPSGRSRTHGPS